MNPFEQQAFELFHEKTGYSDIIAENAYKGFVERDGIIYILFENKEKIITNEEQKYSWTILDEILIKKSVLRTPIQESVYLLFSENMKLAHITTDGEVADIPLVVYPVDKVNNIYENIYYSNETNQETYLITLPRETEDLGHIFTFTTEILPSNQDVESIKRMVIFSKDALYMLTKPNKNVFENILLFVSTKRNKLSGEFPIIYYLQSCYNMLYLYIDVRKSFRNYLFKIM